MSLSFPKSFVFSSVVMTLMLFPTHTSAVEISFNSMPQITNLSRYGLNLGGSGSWGAEQLRSNILNNPGFEPVLDRTLLIVSEKGFHRFADDNSWLARTDGFWNNGDYDVRSGSSAGESGVILDSRKRNDGLAEIAIDKNIAGLTSGDVVVLSRPNDIKPAPGWWRGPGQIMLERTDLPAQNAGKQALRMQASATSSSEILQYFDNIGDRAGKLLPVDGKWQIILQAKALAPTASLHLHFDRKGHRLFPDEVIQLSQQWQTYHFNFNADDIPQAGILTFSIKATDGDLLIDDVYLGKADHGIAGFRPEVIATLRQLNPGFLRDWQGQLGDSLANRLAPENSHQPVRYRPSDHDVQFHYSLPDFLALCAEVNAEPWIVAPTTLNDSEWQQLGAYLTNAANLYHFKTIMLEFGNENWNPLFRPGGIPNNQMHAEVADRAFRLLKIGSKNDDRIITTLNAQFANPDSPSQLAKLSREAQRIAVAPYFLYRLNRDATPKEGRQQALNEPGDLFNTEHQATALSGKSLSVYEVNLHTTLGDADEETRNTVVTSAASGVALAKRLLQATQAGIREQAVYSFSGFDSYLQEGKGLVHLWGITRDLVAVGHFRPTGLALQMLNQIAGGNTYTTDCKGDECAQLTSLGFNSNRLAIVSTSPSKLPIELSIQCQQNSDFKLEWLDGGDINANNERHIMVTIQHARVGCQNNKISFSLPPYSFAVLYPASSTTN